MWYYGPPDLDYSYSDIALETLAPGTLPPAGGALLVDVHDATARHWLEKLLLRDAWVGRLYVLHPRQPEPQLKRWLEPLQPHRLLRDHQWRKKLAKAPALEESTRAALRQHVWQREWAKFSHDARKALHHADPGPHIQQILAPLLSLHAAPQELQTQLEDWYQQLPQLSLIAIDEALQRWNSAIDLPVQALRWRSIQRHWQALSPADPLSNWDSLIQVPHPQAAEHLPHLEHELRSLLPRSQWQWRYIAAQPISATVIPEGRSEWKRPLQVLVVEANPAWRETLAEAVQLVASEYQGEVEITAVATVVEAQQHIQKATRKRSGAKKAQPQPLSPPHLVIVSLPAIDAEEASLRDPYFQFLNSWVLPTTKRGQTQFPLLLLAPKEPNWELFRKLYSQGLAPQDVILKTGLNYLVQRLRVWLGQLGHQAQRLELVLDRSRDTVTFNGHPVDWSEQPQKIVLLEQLMKHPEGILSKDLPLEDGIRDLNEKQISDRIYSLTSRLITDAQRWGIYLHPQDLIVRTDLRDQGVRYQLSRTHRYQQINSYDSEYLEDEELEDEDGTSVPLDDFCVWVVEDDPLWRDQVGGLLAEMGIPAVMVADLEAVQTRLEMGPAPALVCLDLAIPAQAGGVPIPNGGLTALTQIRAHYPEVAVVVMSTQFHSPQLMAEALRERISLHDVLAKGDTSGQWLTQLYQRLWIHQRRYRRLAILGNSDGLPRITVRITDWQPQPPRLSLAVNGEACGPYSGHQARLLYVLLTAPQGGLSEDDAYQAIYDEERPNNDRQEKYEQLLKNVRRKIAKWPAVDWEQSGPQQVLLKSGQALCLQVQFLG